MPFYADSDKEEIRSRVDIADVVGECVHLKKNGSNYVGLCPFHSEKTPSFSVAPAKGMFYCFGCHEGGDVFAFVQKYYNYSFTEAMEYLADRAGIKLAAGAGSPDSGRFREKRDALIEINTEAARFFHDRMKNTPEGQKAFDYFRGRGLKEETIVRFGLGFSPAGHNELFRYLREKGYADDLILESGLAVHYDSGTTSDKFRNRAMFPIFDMRGRVIGFGGRVMGEGEPKYLNSPDTPVFIKRENLYAYNIAKKSRSRRLILCEGYMDVISLHQAGFDYAVASLGTSLTSGHVSLIKRLGVDVYVCYDSDKAGTNAAAKAIGLFGEAGVRTKVIHMDPAKDPDEYIKSFGADSFQERIMTAENSFLFLMGVKSRDYDMSDPTEKTAFYGMLAEEIYKAGGALGWKSYTEAVCKKFNIDIKAMEQAVSEAYRKMPVVTADTRMEEFTGGEPEALADRRTARAKVRGKKEESIFLPQKKLLSWLAEEPGLYSCIKGVITTGDFTGDAYVTMAGLLFNAIESGNVSVPAVVEQLPGEYKAAAAECFSTVLEDAYKSDKGKAMTDLIVRIKEIHIKDLEENSDIGDMSVQQRLMVMRSELQKFKQKGIRF